jgi:poly [ADP-ribose] polymerase
MGKIAKLILVSGDVNSNKWYDMKDNEDGSFTASWGRVGAAGSSKNYPIKEWDTIHRQKTSKGYEDITHLCALDACSSDDIQVSDPHVKELVAFLQSCARDTVKKNYTVAASSVTDKQIEAAQTIIDDLVSISRGKTFPTDIINFKLLSLYKVIPRKMSDPRKHILQPFEKVERLNEIISVEQALLDVMQGQMAVTATGNSSSLDDYGIEIEVASDEDRKRISKETDFILSSNHKVFKIINKHTETSFVKGEEKLFYHGSRNENWWNIISKGLLIRPSNAVHTGSMFGDAIYFANKARKSIGYTSLSGSYWANGSAKKAYLAVFAVNLGKTWSVLSKERWSSWMSRLDQKTVSSKGYDSVFAEGGADLRNDEFMIYSGNRCTVRYLIEITQ